MTAGIKNRWDAQQQTLEGHSYRVRAVAFSPDGKTLASALYDYTVRLWDAATSAPQQMLMLRHALEHLSFSRNGEYLETDRGLLGAGLKSDALSTSEAQKLLTPYVTRWGSPRPSTTLRGQPTLPTTVVITSLRRVGSRRPRRACTRANTKRRPPRTPKMI
ncbi:hypothetical protein F5Y17DRAFT_254305 [Xylariaceae sp. FL0594]|nr:hypothetical protein F5Y17DRAFT_254305 [Xylariaceae sp. FL0594]